MPWHHLPTGLAGRLRHPRAAVHPRACRPEPAPRRCTLLLVIAFLPWLGWPRPGFPEAGAGTVILVGDVLRFNQRDVWSRIAGQAPDLVIIAAASDRPKLYGDFARRALERHGAFADLLPVAVDPAEFGIDHRRATGDPVLAGKVREAGGVFFVGGAPQRLAEVLFRDDGSPTPLAAAVAEAYAAGGVIVGGIPGPIGLFTGIDAVEALEKGRISPDRLHRGLGLIAQGWLVDQHAFTAGRFAEILVAMRQLGIMRGLGIGADTAAVVEGGQVEVVGDEGILLFELSGGRGESGAAGGFRLAGARLSYFEHGDRFDMSSLEVEPAAAKLDGFEVGPGAGDRQPLERSRPAADDLFARGRLLQLLHEAIDGPRSEAFGFVFPQGVGGGGRGFRFRFHPRADTFGWLSARSGIERYTIVNLGLEITPARRKDMPDMK